MKWNKLHRVLLVISILILLLNGCGATEQLKRHYQESFQTYYVPEDLGANSHNTGLLLVDAVSMKPLNKMRLAGVAIANIKEPEKEIAFGSFIVGGFLGQLSGVVVLPDLQPGTYKIVKIKTENINMWETQFMPTTKEFEIEITAGKPVYFGQIEVKHPFASTDSEVSIKYSTTREQEAWEMVVNEFSESSWVNAINEHVNGLR